MFRDTTAQDRPIAADAARSRKKLWRGVGIGAAVLAVIWVGRQAAEVAGWSGSVSASRVIIDTVERGPFVRDVAGDGKIVAAVSPTIYAPASGVVSYKVRPGEQVDLGQMLAQVVSPELVNKLQEEQATLESLQTGLAGARLDAERRLREAHEGFEAATVNHAGATRDLDRSRKAFERGAYSELEMLRAEDTLSKTAFALKQAKAQLEAQPKQNEFDLQSRRAQVKRQEYIVENLRRQVQGLEVRSPVKGQVGMIHTMDRALIAKDVPLLTVVDLTALEVEMRIPEGIARDVAVGAEAEVEAGGRRWQCSVNAVSPEVVSGQVLTRLRFAEGEQPVVRQNQRVQARVTIERRSDVLQVDRGSFVEREGGTHAYVVADGVARRTPIRIGAVSIHRVEISEGLKAGDRVVVSGTEIFKGADTVGLSE